jgi:hypothetical protein
MVTRKRPVAARRSTSSWVAVSTRVSRMLPSKGKSTMLTFVDETRNRSPGLISTPAGEEAVEKSSCT